MKKNPTAHRDACSTKLPGCALCQQERYAEAYTLLHQGRLYAGSMLPTYTGVSKFWNWAREVATFQKEHHVIDPPDPTVDPTSEEARFKLLLDVIEDGCRRLQSERPPSQAGHTRRFTEWAAKARKYVEDARR